MTHQPQEKRYYIRNYDALNNLAALGHAYADSYFLQGFTGYHQPRRSPPAFKEPQGWRKTTADKKFNQLKLIIGDVWRRMGAKALGENKPQPNLGDLRKILRASVEENADLIKPAEYETLKIVFGTQPVENTLTN